MTDISPLEVPEIGDLSRLRHVLDKLATEPRAAVEVSTLSQRQVQYALQTSRVLGLVSRAGKTHTLTDAGRALLAQAAGSVDEASLLKSTIASCELVREVLPDLLSGADVKVIAAKLEQHPRTRLRPSTAKKRAAALAKWSAQLTHSRNSTRGPVAIVHLSDIHLTVERGANPILSRSSHLADIIAARCEEAGTSCVVLAITGDVAFSGAPAEYAHAESFLSEIIQRLAARLTLPIHSVCVPGNHDCDFENSTSVRRNLLNTGSAEVDDDFLDACLPPQQPFVKFSFSGAPKIKAIEKNKLLTIATADLGGIRIEYRLYNTAWCSTLDEQQGSLFFPEAYFAPNSSDCDVVATLFHHPYNWLESNNARRFREHVERSSDLVLTGHEHIPGRYEKIHYSGEHIEYVEGGVLQESGDPDHSQFNILLIDLARRTQRTIIAGWSVTDQLYRIAEEYSETPFRRNQYAVRAQFPLEQDYLEQVLDPEQPYKHPRKATPRLSDIYTYPFLSRATGFGARAEDELIRRPLDQVLKCKNVMVVGGELTGKSALARMLFLDLYRAGYIPVLLHGDSVESCGEADITHLLSRQAEETYGAGAVEIYSQLDRKKKVVIVDDFHRSPLNAESKDTVVESLERRFGHVVVLASDDLRITLLSGLKHGHSRLLSFDGFTIQAFGCLLRYELLERWCFLGMRSTDKKSDLLNRAHQLGQTLTRALGKNLLPSYPALVLMCVQQLEAASSETSMGSFGHLYEALITQNLRDGVGGRQAIVDLDGKRRFLSQFAHLLYEHESESLSTDDFDDAIDDYLGTYDVSYPKSVLRGELFASGLIQQRQGRVRFRYRYAYCFFVAEHLRHHLDEEATSALVEHLCANVNHEDSANILLFLAHLSRSKSVLRTLLSASRSHFASEDGFDLQGAIKPLRDSSHISRLQLDDAGPESHRREELRKRDEVDATERNDDQLPPAVREYTAALKTVQIIGQVLRSFPGSTEPKLKLELLQECYSLGVRSAASLIGLVVSEHEAFVEEVANMIVVSRPELRGDLSKVRNAVRQYLVFLCEAVYYSAVLNVSDSVGLPALKRSYKKVLEADDNVPFRFIDLAIKLDHFSAFPEDETKVLEKKLRKDLGAKNVLRRLIWRHLYLYPTSYKLRQSLCSRFDIKQTAMIASSNLSKYTKLTQPSSTTSGSGRVRRKRRK